MKKYFCGLIAVLALCGLWAITQSADVHAKYISGSSKTIHLSVRKPKYTVVFDANADASEISGEMDNQEFDYGTEKALTANAYKREGYGFVSWNTKADGTGTSYTDKQSISNLSEEEGAIITLYAQWGSPMPEVFRSSGICEFNGEIDGVGQAITGDDCEFANGERTYIDTGVELYSEENYEKDFEIGFKIVEYNYQSNVNQATFASSKFESGSENSGNPGFVVRRSGNSDSIEISQMIENIKKMATVSGRTTTEVKMARVDGKLYYSINGGEFIFLQSNVNTDDYHTIPMWFGAAPSITMDGDNMVLTPHRFLKAKLSDIYIKVGDYDSFKNIITFIANGEGATVNPTEKEIFGDVAIGALPTPVWENHAFAGWYTDPVDGARIREDYVATDDMVLYAHWLEDNDVCKVNVGGDIIGGSTTLQGCVDAAGTSGQATITVLKDVSANVTVHTGQDIEFDLGQNIWSAASNSAVIENQGTIHIINGTIRSGMNNAVINNQTTNSYAYITGGNIIATGAKQAVYNKSGYLEISGDTYLSNTSGDRAAVHNLNNGIMIIKGGTIEASGFAAVRNESPYLTIGEQGNGIRTTPVIRGATYGVSASANFEFYDGVLVGVSGATDNPSKIVQHDGTLTDGTEEINGITYQTLHNE